MVLPTSSYSRSWPHSHMDRSSLGPPVHPGYLKLRFTRADVLYPEGGPLDAAYRDVDRFVAMAEAFHRLRCSKRITVHSDLFDAVHQWNMGRWRSLAA